MHEWCVAINLYKFIRNSKTSLRHNLQTANCKAYFNTPYSIAHYIPPVRFRQLFTCRYLPSPCPNRNCTGNWRDRLLARAPCSPQIGGVWRTRIAENIAKVTASQDIARAYAGVDCRREGTANDTTWSGACFNQSILPLVLYQSLHLHAAHAAKRVKQHICHCH